MRPDELAQARSCYSYVPAKLIHANADELSCIDLNALRLAPSIPSSDWHSDKIKRKAASSIELDGFHHALLNSQRADDVLHGLLSVVFWGYVSGTDGKIRKGYALARTSWLSHGKKGFERQDQAEQLAHLISARSLLEKDRLGEALIEVMRIKHLGMAFGSKLLAFLAPDKAAVYDDVISLRLSKSVDETLKVLGGMAKSSNRRRQAETYERWCNWCRDTAASMNAAGRTWSDWNDTEVGWRAVDAERAFFALGR